LPGLFPEISYLIPTKAAPEIPKPHTAEISDTLIIQKADSSKTAETAAHITINSEKILASFIDSISESKQQVRIMYYGDSQIEGDRITSYLRHALREGRKGTGPGLFLPVMPVMYTKSLWLKSSPSWERYNYLSYRAGEISHNRLGPFMAICRFLPPGKISPSPQKAWVRIRPSQFADSSSAEYDLLRIFYSNPAGKVWYNVTADNIRVLTDSLKISSEVNEADCRLKGAKDIIIEFQGKVSPDIYGISIESSNGIIVDNIPQRGSAGLEFTMTDKKNLRAIYEKLKPDLIILQYGLNIVRNVRNDYSYYKKGLYRQVERVKEVSPGTGVIVIGVTDMASGEGDSVKSYRNIPSIIKSQKEAANEAGAIFWDSYGAMGGESSIIKWSKKKPALAQTDNVHFTYQGADSISKMLYGYIISSGKKDTSKFMTTKNVPDTSHIKLVEAKAGQQTLAALAGDKLKNLVSDVLSYDPDRPMIFSTAAFWIFFLMVMAGYSLVYRKPFIRNFYLLIVSLYFYYKSGGLFLFLLILVTVVDYSAGLLIHHSRKKVFKRLFIFLSLLSNLGILAYFKYTGFFINIINDIFGTGIQVHDFLASFSNLHLGTSFDVNSIILPVGISFFTFQSLSYTIDVYRGKLKPVRNIVDFGFYVSFFPQLVAGPIVRASEFIPQLYNRFSLSKREFGYALFLICKGLIKKIIISDFIAINFIDRVFDLPSSYSGFENLMAIYGYGLQIYCDFSGYTDIAIGLGLLMGFRLPVNFNSPYKASSVSDFWKRWHISLSRWLKDYLYISLGGNRKGKFRTYVNLFVTMLLGGLWHGAALKFIIWGGLHGIGLVINKIWDSIVGDRLASGRFGRAFSVFLTFNFVSFCWIFFRAPDMNSAFIMMRQITESFSPGSYLTVLPAYGSVFMLIITGYLIHLLPEKIKESYRGLFIGIPVIAKIAVVMVVAVLLLQMRTTIVMPFIYFRF
jgi:D-alanyl-lipoteichoic acid acyltransferase DltB (MBOAT superfamily)/lysophospholipase L1-like esterase